MTALIGTFLVDFLLLRQKSHSWLSTGWFTMVIAIEICDNIKVYGMVAPNHCG